MTQRMTGFPGRYSPFLRRQEADLKAFHEDEDLALDPHMDYSGVAGISSEVKEKLAVIRPTTIVGGSNSDQCAKYSCPFQGAAKRMEGMTPSSVVLLLKHAKRTQGLVLVSLAEFSVIHSHSIRNYYCG
jgi:tRNA uridine 5-carboxymethylaminomethyl modification enzyme